MKGIKNRTRSVFVSIFLVIVFLLFTVFAAADNVYMNQLFNRLQLINNKLGNQEATLIGALSIEGYTYTDNGYISGPATGLSINSTSSQPDQQLLTQTTTGVTCIGNCESKAESSNTKVFTASSTSATEQIDVDISTTTIGLGSTTVTEIQIISSSTSIVDTATSTTLEQKNEVEDSDRDNRSSGSSSSNSSQLDNITTTSSTDSASSTTSATSTDVDFELSEDEINQLTLLEQFTYKLSRVVYVLGDNIGIGESNPLFSLTVKGWLYSSQGFLTGPVENPVGFGMTEQGICLGSCDFDLPSSDSDTTSIVVNNTDDELSVPVGTSTAESVSSSTPITQESDESDTVISTTSTTMVVVQDQVSTSSASSTTITALTVSASSTKENDNQESTVIKVSSSGATSTEVEAQDSQFTNNDIATTTDSVVDSEQIHTTVDFSESLDDEPASSTALVGATKTSVNMIQSDE